jgi:parallel beta-helix repeat protein
VEIAAGDDSNTPIAHNYTIAPNTVYWFDAGDHTIGNDQFAQISAASGDIFVGAANPTTGEPEATIDGQKLNLYAFSSATATNVTIEYLNIENFMAGSGEAVVGQGATNTWTIQDNVIENNPHGAGAAITTNGVVTDNCLYNNGEYGYTAQGEHGTENNVTLTNNDIASNNGQGYYDVAGSTVQCGCSGGGKFWQTTNATVTGNYIHDNIGPGVWVDTDNAGFNISGNYISSNWGEGIMYEISYNAQITNNTLKGNTIGEGSTQASPGFPDGAIYISESGGDSRVASNYAGQLLIQGNVLTNNWGGVVLWENANRYCSDGSDGACTLVNPSVYTLASCAANLSETSPIDYYDNCRWKTQNVLVTKNVESFSPGSVATNCTVANLCGFTALFSNYGTSIYGSSRTVAVTFQQNNQFTNNTYMGSWSFFAWSQSNLDNPVSYAQWTSPVTDRCDQSGELSSGTCNSGFGQDTGSTINA